MGKNIIKDAINNNKEMIIHGIDKIYKDGNIDALSHQNLSSIPILRLIGNIYSVARDHGIEKFGSILEVGCGHGHITRWLRSITKNIIAFDASAEAIEAAKCQAEYGDIFIVGDGINPESFIKDKFDLIIISEFHPFKRPVLNNASIKEYNEFYTSVVESYIQLLSKGGLLIVAHEIANTECHLEPSQLKTSLPVAYFSPRKFAIEDLVMIRPIANLMNLILRVLLTKKYTNFYIYNK